MGVPELGECTRAAGCGRGWDGGGYRGSGKTRAIVPPLILYFNCCPYSLEIPRTCSANGPKVVIIGVIGPCNDISYLGPTSTLTGY